MANENKRYSHPKEPTSNVPPVDNPDETAGNIPSVNNPVDFMQGFRSSSLYQQAIDSFFSGKNIGVDVTEEDKQRAFERTNAGVFALLTYGEKKTHLVYDPAQYTDTARAAIDTYVDYVRFEQEKKREGVGQEELQTIDSTRSALHGQVAAAFVLDDIAATSEIGRAMGRLLLVDQGLEQHGQYRRDLEARAKQSAPPLFKRRRR